MHNSSGVISCPTKEIVLDAHIYVHLLQSLHNDLLIATSSKVISIQFSGHISTHFLHFIQLDFLIRSSLFIFCDSGFAHHKHERGQPFKNTTVLIPGPSWRLYL